MELSYDLAIPFLYMEKTIRYGIHIYIIKTTQS